MASLIINQGAGPRPVALTGTVTIGSNPACDIVLEHPTAMGCRITLQPKRFGYRVTLVKGEMQLNEQPAQMADLEHNDTLRIGEVLLLYKQPEGDAFASETGANGGSASAVGAMSTTSAAGDGAGLGALEPAPSELEDALERARRKRLEALRRLGLAEAGQSLDGLPDVSAPGALKHVATLDAAGVAALEKLAANHGLGEATFPEILAEAERSAARNRDAESFEMIELDELDDLEELETLEEIPAAPPPELDAALQRARWKRMAALDVLRRAEAGQRREALPDLSADSVLARMRELEAAGGAGELTDFEQRQGLADETPRALLDRADRLWTRREQAERDASERAAREAAARESAAREAAASAARHAADEPEALEALEELEVLEELEELEEVGELEELPELEELGEAEEIQGLADLEPLDERGDAAPRDVPAAVPPVRSASAAGSSAAHRAPPAPAPVLRPGSAAALDRGATGGPLRAPPSPPTSDGVRPAGTPGRRPPGARPLPARGIVFRHPLPAGRAAPTFLPPRHPGSPPA